MALKVGELFATLNLDDSGFNSSLNGAKNSALKTVGNIAKTLGALKLGKDIMDSYIDFESAFAGVKKTVDETATTSYADLEKSIRDMSKELPASVNEIAAVAEAAGQLGIGADDIASFTKVMVDLGESTNMTSEEAATTLARLANIMGTSSSEYSNLGSTIVDLGNSFATTESEIADMAMRIAGAGSQIGMSEADVLGFSAAFSSVGIAADAGGSAFSTFASNLSLAVSKGGKDLKKYAKVAGMNSKEFKKAFEEDATGAILTFIDGLGKSEDGIKVLSELGITEIRQRDALLRAAGASETFIEAINKANEAYEENNALTEEARKRYETTASKIAMLKNRFVDLGISIGAMMAPALNTLIDGAIGIIDWATGYDTTLGDKIKAAISNIPAHIEKGIAAAKAKIASIDWGVIWDNIRSSYGAMQEKISGVLSRVGLAIKTGLRAAGGILDTIPWDKLWAGISNSYDALKGNVSAMLGKLPGIINEMLADAKNFLAGGTFAAFGDSVISLISKGIEAKSGGGAAKILTAISSIVSKINWEDAISAVGSLGEFAITAISQGIAASASGASTLINAIGSILSSTLSPENVESVIGTLSGIGSGLIDAIAAGIATVSTAGVDIINAIGGIISGISWDTIGTQVGAFATGLIGKLVEKIGTTDFTGVISAIGSALGAAASGLADAAKGLAASIVLFLLDADTWVGFGKALVSIIEGAFAGVKAFIEEVNPIPVTEAEGWAEAAASTAQGYLEKFQSGAITLEQLVNIAFAPGKDTDTELAIQKFLLDNGYINEAGEIIDVPIITNPVPAAESTTPEDTVANIVSQSVENAKAEIEVPVEVSSVQAATLGNGAKTELGNAGTQAGQLFNSSLGTALANTSGVSAALSQITTSVRNQALGISASGTQGGKMFSSGLAAGIRAGKSSITSAAREVARAAVSAANAALKIQSPSRVMMKSGGYFDEGFAKGILKEAATVRNASAYMANMAVNAASIRNPAGRWGGMGNALAQFAGGNAGSNMPPIRLTTYLNGREVSEAMSDDTAYTQNDRSGRIAVRYGSVAT